MTGAQILQVGVNLESVELFCLVVLAALPSSSGWERGEKKGGGTTRLSTPGAGFALNFSN